MAKAGTNAWAKARERGKEERAGGFLDPGTYKARVVAADIERSQRDNAIRVHWKYMVVQGDNAGTIQHDWSDTTVLPENKGGFTNEDAMAWLCQRLHDFAESGIDFDYETLSPETLPQICKAIAKAMPRCKFRLVERDGYTNVKGLVVFGEDKQDDDADDLSLEDCRGRLRETNGKGGRGKGPAEAAAPAARKAGRRAEPTPADDEEDETAGDDDDEPEPVPVPKRGRGRPRGSVNKPKEPEPEPTSADDEPAETEDLKVGSKVAFTYKREEATGTCIDFDDDAGTATVKIAEPAKHAKRKVEVKLDDLEALDD